MSKKYSTYEMRRISTKIVLIKDKKTQKTLREALDSCEDKYKEIKAVKELHERKIKALHGLLENFNIKNIYQ